MKKEKSIVEKKSLDWAGAGILIKKAQNPKDLNIQKMIMALSVAFDIPPQGITVLADTPYINKVGLEYAFDRYSDQKGWGHFISKPVELAKSPSDTAVFVTELYSRNGRVICNGYGTASQDSIRMGTIRPFLNEMAETRSQNRCLRKVLSPILYETFVRNIASLSKDQVALVSQASKNFGSVTAEEITYQSGEPEQETMLTEKEMAVLQDFLQRISSAKTQEELKNLGVLIKAGVKVGKFNENQVKFLKEAWVKKSSSLTFKDKK